jgi:hypothetical protein
VLDNLKAMTKDVQNKPPQPQSEELHSGEGAAATLLVFLGFPVNCNAVFTRHM